MLIQQKQIDSTFMEDDRNGRIFTGDRLVFDSFNFITCRGTAINRLINKSLIIKSISNYFDNQLFV